ncbi:MAG: hypothetical protein AB1633_05315 [Elusimicrobiota bacterium]
MPHLNSLSLIFSSLKTTNSTSHLYLISQELIKIKNPVSGKKGELLFIKQQSLTSKDKE